MTGTVQHKIISRPFDVTVGALRRALKGAGLTVVGQLDLSRRVSVQSIGAPRECALLMVDCPLLFFEAVALERSAAVFLPMHLVLTGDQNTTSIHWAHPAAGLGLRVSPTAQEAVDALVCRVREVLGRTDKWTESPKPRKAASSLLRRRRPKAGGINVQ